MENEKKNGNSPAQNNQQGRKHKPHKHKSYFMTPADGQKKPSAEKQPQNKPKHNHHNKPKNKDNSSQQQANKANNNEAAKPAQAPEKKTNAGNQQPQNASHRSKNKRKHHHEKKQEQAQSTPLTNTIEKIGESVTDTVTPTTPAPKRSDRLEKPAPKKPEKFSSSSDYDKYSEYEEFSVAELYGGNDQVTNTGASDKSDTKPAEDISEPMIDVVGIRFKASGKTYYFAPKNLVLKTGSHAIVETARGLEYGEVALGNTKVKESETVPPLRPVVRIATDADKKHHAENKEKEDIAFRVCNEKIIEHELDMKLIDAQYTFDNSKLLFYFTSSGRVDFRNLVKDLAGVFRTRIELRQIGIRDEAKMVGGLGLCGRPLCCSLFLTDFGQVSIKMAKEQNLSLNSSKISGICGRLMCCLRYEHETYEYEIKRTPPVDSLVKTVDGIGVVTEISPLAGTVKVRLNDSPEVPPKSYKRDDITVLKKKKEN